MTDHARNLRLCAHPFLSGEITDEVRQTMITAAEEIDRLRALVVEMSPFVVDDVRTALDMGPHPEGRPVDDCADCAWRDRMIGWATRINAGELTGVSLDG